MLQRMSLADPAIRMPPLGTEQLDLEGVAVVRAWIDSLGRGNAATLSERRSSWTRR